METQNSSDKSGSATKKRRLPTDAMWCFNNRETLTARSFFEHFDLLERQYAHSRYKIIISKYMGDDWRRLESDFEVWKKSAEAKEFWTEKSRKRIKLNAALTGIDLIDQAIRSEGRSSDAVLSWTWCPSGWASHPRWSGVDTWGSQRNRVVHPLPRRHPKRSRCCEAAATRI